MSSICQLFKGYSKSFSDFTKRCRSWICTWFLKLGICRLTHSSPPGNFSLSYPYMLTPGFKKAIPSGNIRFHHFLVSGFWLLVTGYWLLVSGFWLLVTGYWLLVTGYWFLATGYWFLDTGYWLLVSGFWLLVSGYWLLVTGYWLLVTGFWILVSGYWMFLDCTI